MDFRDSPAEAEFRSRLRAWIAANNPGLPVSSTDDEYWARQAEWHTALYDAGFFGLSWPSRFGGHDLPSVFDVILDGWVRVYFYVHKLAGYVLASFLLAGLAGLTKR